MLEAISSRQQIIYQHVISNSLPLSLELTQESEEENFLAKTLGAIINQEGIELASLAN